jgi:hypothetical protein
LNLFIIRFLYELLISVLFSLSKSVNSATDEGGIFLSMNEYNIRLSKNSKLSFPIYVYLVESIVLVLANRLFYFHDLIFPCQSHLGFF